MTDIPRGLIRDVQHARNVEAWIRVQLRRRRKGLASDSRFGAVMTEWAIWSRPFGNDLSRHLRLELAARWWTGRPLEPGEPVPGCDCEGCIGCVPACPVCTEPVARPQPRQHAQGDRLPLDVDRARAIPIEAVAGDLGLDMNRRGYALCPFHEDARPSLHVNARKGHAFCNPCGRRWDGIGLVMEMRGLDFPTAVRWLLNEPEPVRRSA